MLQAFQPATVVLAIARSVADFKTVIPVRLREVDPIEIGEMTTRIEEETSRKIVETLR
jgi:hypothetical protein